MTMLEHALQYAAQGWAVLPLHSIANGRCTCGNPDCGSPGKHPLISGGCKSATIDPQTIEGWWRAHPAANIGIATGQISRLVVVDVDTGEGKVGFESLAALEETREKLPHSARVRTGSGGLHIYLAAPEAEICNRASKLAPNIDIRGKGGYVVAPPSLHLSGNTYSWEAPSA